MEQLIIEASAKTPKINFDPKNKKFEITGESRPEDVKTFYDPIFEWLDNFQLYLKSQGSKDEIVIKMYLEYFNSASAKYLLNLTKKLSDFKSVGVPIAVEWLYVEEDEDMKEAGEEIEQLSDIPFIYTVVH